MGLTVLNLTVLGCVAATLLAALALLHLVERAVGRFVAHRLGWRAVLVTGWLGVPVHELSHLLACFVFRHRIVGWSLFDPDPATGTLGYVRHAYRRRSPWQLAGGFFIGVAPLAGGAAILALLLAWMVAPARHLGLVAESGAFAGAAAPDAALLAALGRRLGELALGLATEVWRARTAWLPLQLYLCIAVAAHLAPSRRDLIGGLAGGLLVAVALVGAAVAAGLAGVSFAPGLLLVPLAALLVGLAALFAALHATAVAIIAAVFGRR